MRQQRAPMAIGSNTRTGRVLVITLRTQTTARCFSRQFNAELSLMVDWRVRDSRT
jgi:hypothetical protein